MKIDEGIHEIYGENQISLGISKESIKSLGLFNEDEIKELNIKDVYIFNLFLDDEYINILGTYKKVKDTFVDVESNEMNAIELLVNEWNKLEEKENK
jgi:hypothetical protein